MNARNTRQLLKTNAATIPAAEQCRGSGQTESFPGADTRRRTTIVCPTCSRTFNVRVGRAGTIRLAYVPRHRASENP